jgi:mRNA interferase RelE/StbE
VSEAPWRLRVMPAARRELEGLPERYAAAILDFLPAVASNPRRLGKPLRFELEGKLAARRGPYRIVYELDPKTHTVRVVAIAHRVHVYRRR